MFSVDVTDIEQGERDPQNAEEAIATIEWKTLKGVQSTNDWKAKTILFNKMKAFRGYNFLFIRLYP